MPAECSSDCMLGVLEHPANKIAKSTAMKPERSYRFGFKTALLKGRIIFCFTNSGSPFPGIVPTGISTQFGRGRPRSRLFCRGRIAAVTKDGFSWVFMVVLTRLGCRRSLLNFSRLDANSRSRTRTSA